MVDNDPFIREHSNLNVVKNALKSFDIDKNNYVDDEHFRKTSEASMMHLLFSKYTYDTESTPQSNKNKYASFFLKSNTKEFLEYEQIPLNIHITEDDYDISFYASNTMKRYMLYLDIVSAIYKYTETHSEIPQKELKLNVRYNIVENEVLFQPSLVVIDLARDSVDKITSIITTHNLHEFHRDIIEHLNFAAKLDNESRLFILQFYKMCRLYIMYVIVLSIYRVTGDNKVIQYHDQTLSPVYTVLNNVVQKHSRDLENLEVVSSNINKTNVLKAKSHEFDVNVGKTNNKIAMYQKYSSIYESHKKLSDLSYFVLAAVILITCIIYIFNIDAEKRVLFGIFTFSVVCALYTISYYGVKNKEYFENVAPITILEGIREKCHRNFDYYLEVKNNKIFSQHLMEMERKTKEQSLRLQNRSRKIEGDKNVKHIESGIFEYDFHLIYRLSILISILVIIHNYENNVFVLLYIVLSILMLVIIHQYYTLRIVRTMPRNFYWQSPSTTSL